MLPFQRNLKDAMSSTNEASNLQQQNEQFTNNTVSIDKQQQEQGYLTVSNRQEQVRKSTYLLVIMFTIGALSLWLMVKKSTPTSAKASELTANQKGNFSNGVTTIQCMYAPEFTSHSEGVRVIVE